MTNFENPKSEFGEEFFFHLNKYSNANYAYDQSQTLKISKWQCRSLSMEIFLIG